MANSGRTRIAPSNLTWVNVQVQRSDPSEDGDVAGLLGQASPHPDRHAGSAAPIE